MRRVGAILLVVAAIALPSVGSAQQKLFKWKDENGVVQYGDKVPPEYANRDRDVLNQQGVRVGSEEGEITPAEAAAAQAREAAAQADQKAKDEIARRDRMLLTTYISVADIEDRRNRRLELLESQTKVIEVYLGNLRKKLVDLQTTSTISLYEQTLARTRADQATQKQSFDADIARFRELKGG